ncbi:MAG: carboxypeptidase regulatory-like domain-containing protein, partial [Verrucomicrobia bacterium]|nr:carboxypeptidase regulatory-like domain-containing protein [Verrucomicrobiota bacterium]
IPFEIKDGKGNVLVKGNYQDAVSRSTAKGTVIFGPRVRDLEKPNGDAWITNIVIESFEDFTTDADFRSDGLGVVGAKRVTRSKVPGASLNFGFDVILPPDDSKFLSILTDAPSFALNGKVTIFASNDFGGNSFSTTLNNTAAPAESSDYVMDGAQTGDKVCPGEKIPGTYDYHFEGILVGSPLDFGVYLSVDNNITTADRLLTRVSSTTTTTAGAASGVSFTALLPSDVAPGAYFIGVIIDDRLLVAETDEKNNTSKPQSITILDCRPDLQPGNYSIPASACPGDDIGPETFLAVVNVGPGEAGTSTVGYYLSKDNVFSADDVLLVGGRDSVPALPASSNANVTANVNTIPAGTAPGNYFIIAVVDELSVIAESNEGNNTSAKSITILDCRPDLQPGNYSIPASACPSEDIGPETFLAVVNVGPGDAEGANAGFYLSKDNVLSVDDVLLIGGRDGVPALPAGSSANITAHNNIIPADTAPGSYFIIAVVDEPKTVSETNENNNTSAKSITILDCTPKSFTISGLVSLANQQPLAGVLIALESGGQKGTRTTDQNGEFKFEGLPEGGTYLLTPSSSDYKFTPASGKVANLSGDASIGFLADKLERPIVPIKVQGVSSPIVLEFDRAVYRSGDLVRARATFGSVKPTETEIALMLVSPVKDDVEPVVMTRISDGVYEIASPIEVKSGGAATKLDGIFLAQPGEMFAGLLYIDSIPSMVGRIAIDIVSDLALLLDPGFVGSPVEVNRALALTEDENKIPQGGKPVGTLLKAGSLPVQIALHELIFAPKESGDLDRFLTRANGKVSMEVEGEDGTTTYLVQVTPSADDLACLRQLRSLFDDKDKLYASNDGALETYSMALKYRLEGFIVGVNPRLQFMAVPSPGEPSVGGAVSRSMANDGPLNVPQVWAFLALWDRDRARIPMGVLDMGFAPNPDFRRRLDGTFIECDMEGRSASDIIGGFRCAPGIAQGPPTVGASFFGPPVWHGTGVVTVAGGVINNGFGSVGTGGQVVEPMLYRYGHSSYVFEIGSGIRRAVLDGAAVINISAGYPCRIIDTVGIEFSICDPVGRAGFCTAATATLSLAAAAVCSTVGPLAGIPIFGPFLSAAAAVACGVTTVAVVTASAACFATLAAGDLRGPMQSAVDFASERGVPIVTSAGNAFHREGLPPVIRDIIDVSERRTERWDIIPAMIPQTIVAGACQDNWPYIGPVPKGGFLAGSGE